MTTRLFYTDIECPEAQYRAQKAFLISYQYDDLDDALGMAKRIIGVGGVPWEIETETGVLGRFAIIELIEQKGAALNNRPKVW
jgi:hypothetical protein